MDNRVMEKHTDLAIEVRESFPEDSVEIDGVCLEKHTLAGGELLVTRVIIKDQHGAEQMGKPVGDYFTLEFQSLEAQETIQKEIYKILERKIQLANRGIAVDESNKALFDAVAKNLTGDCVLIVNTANFNEIFEYIPQFKELGITLVFAELETYKYIVLDRNQIKLLYGQDLKIGTAEDMEDFLKNTLTLGINALSDIAFNPMSITAISK